MSKISTAILETKLEESNDYQFLNLSKEQFDELDSICDQWEDKDSIESEINGFIQKLGYVFDQVTEGECLWELPKTPKYDRVLQFSFDLLIPTNATSEVIDKCINQMQSNIGESEIVCLNGTNDSEDLTESYDLDELNKTFNDTKFIYYTLDVRQSDIENTEKFVAEIPVDQDPQEYINEEASEYYGGECEVQDDGWYFESGCVCVHSPRYKDITEEEYNTLKTYL